MAMKSPTVAEQRQNRAEVLAQYATSWLPVTLKSGEQRFGIPSQTVAGKYHLANLEHCTCRDAAYRSGPCKHRRAVALVLRQYGLVSLPEQEEAYAF